MDTLKDGLKTAREKHRLTQQQLAEILNVNIRNVQNWEQGISTPKWETIRQLQDIYKCDLDHLAGNIKADTHDVQFIIEETGLSEEAINMLKQYKNATDNPRHIYYQMGWTSIIPDLLSFMVTYSDDFRLHNSNVLQNIVGQLFRQKTVETNFNAIPEKTRQACIAAYINVLDTTGQIDPLLYRSALSDEFEHDQSSIMDEHPGMDPDDVLRMMKNSLGLLQAVYEKKNYVAFQVTKELSNLIDTFFDELNL